MVRRANRVDGLGTKKTGESLALFNFIPGAHEDRGQSYKYTGFGKMLDQIWKGAFSRENYTMLNCLRYTYKATSQPTTLRTCRRRHQVLVPFLPVIALTSVETYTDEESKGNENEQARQYTQRPEDVAPGPHDPWDACCVVQLSEMAKDIGGLWSWGRGRDCGRHCGVSSIVGVGLVPFTLESQQVMFPHNMTETRIDRGWRLLYSHVGKERVNWIY